MKKILIFILLVFATITQAQFQTDLWTIKNSRLNPISNWGINLPSGFNIASGDTAWLRFSGGQAQILIGASWEAIPSSTAAGVNGFTVGTNKIYPTTAGDKLYIRSAAGDTTQTNLLNIGGGITMGSAGGSLHTLVVGLNNAKNLNGFNFVNTDVNKIRTLLADTRDTASFSYWNSSLGSPTLSLKGKTGNTLLYADSNGVGMGNTAPWTTLQITKANQTLTGNDNGLSSYAKANLVLETSDTYAANIGPALGFGGIYHSNGTSKVLYGVIAGRKESTGSGTSGYLAFLTNLSGTGLVERMRISGATGFVGINNINPTVPLDVTGKTIITGTPTVAAGESNHLLTITETGTTAGSQGSINGIRVTTTSAGTDSLATVAGVYSYGISNNTSGVHTHLFGVVGRSKNINTGGAGIQSGVYGTFENLGAGTTISGSSFYVGAPLISAGTVTSGYGVKVNQPTVNGSGALTNNYGVYIDNMTAGGTLNYGLYVTGGTTAGIYNGGTFTQTGNMTLVSGTYTGNVLTRGTAAFTLQDEADTVAISGAGVGDFYTITLTGTAAPLAADAIRLEATATGFILHRSASGTSGLTYVWKREK